MSFYNCGIKNFRLPCLPENYFLTEGFKLILHSDNMSGTVHAIFRALFEQVSQENFSAGVACHHLLNALLIISKQLPCEKIENPWL